MVGLPAALTEAPTAGTAEVSRHSQAHQPWRVHAWQSAAGTLLLWSRLLSMCSRGQQRWPGSQVAPCTQLTGCAAQIMAALCGAMQPNVCVMDDPASASARPLWNDGSGEVYLHPSSSLHPLTASKLLTPYLIYSEKVRGPPSLVERPVHGLLGACLWDQGVRAGASAACVQSTLRQMRRPQLSCRCQAAQAPGGCDVEPTVSASTLLQGWLRRCQTAEARPDAGCRPSRSGPAAALCVSAGWPPQPR